MKDNYVLLSPAVFYLLLALIGGEKHGYEMAKVVKSMSKNTVKMTSGTLYGALSRMVDSGLVVRREGRVYKGKVRYNYKITDEGRELLIGDLNRMERAVSVAYDKGVISRFKLNKG